MVGHPLGGRGCRPAAAVEIWALRSALPGVGLIEAIGIAGALAMLAASVLVARSHVRNRFWSNVVLWLGILLVGIGASILLALMPA